MITTARQLKDLIRNMSKKKSADAQILMRNYMMERFLERISLSEYKNQFILKGGMLVAAMVGLDARATMDLDATIKGTNVSVEDVEMIISQIISIPLDDGVSFRVKRISEIMEEADYPGVRVSMETKFDGVITPLKIDISTGDVITPREIKCTGFDEVFDCTLVDRSCQSLDKILQRTILALYFSFFYQRIDDRAAHTLDRRKPITNRAIIHRKSICTSVDIRRKDLNIHLPTYLNIFCHFCRHFNHRCHKRSHKFHRIVIFQKRRLIRNDCISCCMRFIELPSYRNESVQAAEVPVNRQKLPY